MNIRACRLFCFSLITLISALSWAQQVSSTSANLASVPRLVKYTGSAPVGDGSGGAANLVAKWSNASTLANSQIFDDGTKVGIGTSAPNEQLEITGNLRLPTTTGTTGILFAGPNRLLHTFPFGSGNLF